MSYLSMRMREDGWPKRRPRDLTVTLAFDASRFGAACERASRALGDLAERLGYQLDPWQEAMVEAMFADPEAVRRLADPSLHRWALRPDPANPPAGELATRLSCDVIIVDEFRHWEKAQQFDRQRLGFWSTRRGEAE